MKMTLSVVLEMDHEPRNTASATRSRLAGRINDLSVGSLLWMDDDFAALASVPEVRGQGCRV